MGHPGGGAQQHRHIKALGDLKGRPGKVQTFLRIRRLQHGQPGGTGIVTVVLLILGGMHAGIVGGDDDEATAHAVVGRSKNGIRRHIDAHMLHGADASDAGDGSAVGHLRSHLFVGRPFAVKGVFILGEGFKHLCAGRAGICGADFDACFICAPGNGLVAGKERSVQCQDHLSDTDTVISCDMFNDIAIIPYAASPCKLPDPEKNLRPVWQNPPKPAAFPLSFAVRGRQTRQNPQKRDLFFGAEQKNRPQAEPAAGGGKIGQRENACRKRVRMAAVSARLAFPKGASVLPSRPWIRPEATAQDMAAAAQEETLLPSA